MPDLSDAEVICGFMEPHYRDSIGQLHWWFVHRGECLEGWGYTPRTLTLGALWRVEQKLIELDREHCAEIRVQYEMFPDLVWHLAAAQKIAALAKVIRGIK